MGITRITDDDIHTETHILRARAYFCISHSFFFSWGCAMYDGDWIGLWTLCFAIVGRVRFCELARAKVTERFDELRIAHRDKLLDNYV